MNINQGTRGSLQKNLLKLINFGCPSESTCNKQHAGYNVKSGVLGPLSLAQYILYKDKKVNLFTDSPRLNLIPCVLSTDGNALKSCVGLDIPVDIAFIEKSLKITPEFLHCIVTEVVISSVATLDNAISFSCSAKYVPKPGKTGEIAKGKILSQIRALQMCSCCQEITKVDDHIIEYSSCCQEITKVDNHIIEYSDVCSSRCELCVQIKDVFVACIKLGRSSYLPCLTACMRCSKHNQKCIKRIYVAAIADCEEGNKAAFCSLKDEIKQSRINPEFALLTPIPDALHVGKSLKAVFSNWYLKLGNERSNIAIIRDLRNKSTSKVQTEIRKYLPKNDHVRNRDRQDPSSALALTKFYQFRNNKNFRNNKIYLRQPERNV